MKVEVYNTNKNFIAEYEQVTCVYDCNDTYKLWSGKDYKYYDIDKRKFYLIIDMFQN